MSRTEIVKCCGEDGRLLIPKYMRDALHFGDSEPLCLRLDKGCLVLEKYRTMENLESVCSSYLQAFRKVCRCPIVICSTEYVITSRGISVSSSQLLSEKLREHIRDGTAYTFSEAEHISLFKDSGHRIDCIFPVMEEKRSVGAVLLLRCHNVQPSEQLCAGFLAEILSEQLKNQ